MIRFLIKGLLRERSRSLFPILIVSTGVFLCVLLSSWMQGVRSEALWSSAVFASGHLRVMTRAYAEESDQMPNDLAMLNIDGLLDTLKTEFPDYYWAPRIRFGGLLDVPDENREPAHNHR